MTAPLIGISTYGRNEEGQFHLPCAYVDAVRSTGGIPVLIAPGETAVDALLEHLDGLVLTGGGDIDPSLYGGSTHATIYNTDPERDAMEVALARTAFQLRVPTLGICRGMQLTNVALGGALYEHLPDVVGETVLHRLPLREPTTHLVTVAAGSKLAEILNATEFLCTSWHHQAIRDSAVAPLLNVVARAPDGTIEAVETDTATHPWLIAVQWHPELTPATDPIQPRLFMALVRAAASWSAAARRSPPS